MLLTQHTIERQPGSSGLAKWVTPVCSCGWKGRRYFQGEAQIGMVATAERMHLACALYAETHNLADLEPLSPRTV